MTQTTPGDTRLVLVVAEDPQDASHTQDTLHEGGYETLWCASPETMLSAFHEGQPDLVLISTDGADDSDETVLGLCADVRRESDVPVVVLSAAPGGDDAVAMFEAGADDYMARPARSDELLARIKARLREHHAQRLGDGVMVAGDLVIDPNGHTVRRHGVDIALTPIEFSLLELLIDNPSRIFSCQELLDSLWRHQTQHDERLVRVHVQRLRAKIEPNPDEPSFVVTVRGLGYRCGSGIHVQWVPRVLCDSEFGVVR